MMHDSRWGLVAGRVIYPQVGVDLLVAAVCDSYQQFPLSVHNCCRLPRLWQLTGWCGSVDNFSLFPHQQIATYLLIESPFSRQ